MWWAVFSALALLTQYFAGFLIAAEGLLLVYRLRSRASVIALGAQAVVLAPLIPHVVPRFAQQAGFITSQGLATRIQQVPVAFGLNTLFKTPGVSYGLLGAAALAAIVIALLIIGADGRQLRGAGLAALLAAAVLLVPLLLALSGHDDYIARALMPAWLPLAIVVGAACTAPACETSRRRARWRARGSLRLGRDQDQQRRVSPTAGLAGRRRRRWARTPGRARSSPMTVSSRPVRCPSTCRASRGRARASLPARTPVR